MRGRDMGKLQRTIAEALAEDESERLEEALAFGRARRVGKSKLRRKLARKLADPEQAARQKLASERLQDFMRGRRR